MQTQAPPPPKTMMKDPKYGAAEEIMALAPARLAALLRDSQATVYAKAKACQQLAITGGREAVAALEPLLSDARLSHYARFALEPNTDPSAAAALRKALGTLKGPLLIGVVNSLGVRRDRGAIETLAKMVYSEDAALARAANAALARIRPPA
ncbi:MAG: hypothetical protein R2729_20995 [Bryobacteraceae bacterium]